MILCGDVRTWKVDEQTPDGAKKSGEVHHEKSVMNLAAKGAEREKITLCTSPLLGPSVAIGGF